MLQAETMKEVARILDSLPPAQRTVVVLRDVAGYAAPSICNILEITETNMRVLLHRARSHSNRARAIFRRHSAEFREHSVVDCNELVEVITDYLEETLPQHDRERFESHLKECPFCVTYVEQIRATIGALGRIPVESIDAQARARLLDAFRD